MRLYSGSLPLTELRAATALLHGGARAAPEHFQDYELSTSNLGDIVDLLETHSTYSSAGSSMVPEHAAFLEALTSSGSAAVLTNKRYCGNGGMPLPFFVLNSVTVGNPWGSSSPGIESLGSPKDLAFRRVCLRFLARMAFLSAERSLARGATHPFISLLETRHGPGDRGELLPFKDFRAQQFVHPTNQAAFLQVLYLTIFVHRRFPWPSRRQYRADALYRDALSPLSTWEGIELTSQIRRMILTVPGVVQALVVDNNLWHILVTYGVGTRANDRSCPRPRRNHNCGVHFLNSCFGNRVEQDKFVALLRNTRLLSDWFCGQAGRHLLLEVCRQRRRRVVQVISK